jgi:ABC-type oligopeptide transport system substrate-binding subunit
VPGADQLMAQAEAQSDPSARLARYQQAEQQLVQQAAACPLFQYQQLYRVRSYVREYALDALGEVPMDVWAQVYIADHQRQRGEGRRVGWHIPCGVSLACG